LRNHVLKILGDKPIASISHADVLQVFDTLYNRSPLMASRLRANCEAVFSYAKSRHRFDGDNPFAWKGNLDGVYGHVKVTIEHFRAIPYRDVPALYQQLVDMGDTPAALAARLQVVLALRPAEARTLRFDHIDIGADAITLPVTKNGKPFTVPLNVAAIDVIERCQALRTGDFLFAGRDGGSPIGERAIHNVVKKLTGGASCHAVARSCFSTWAYETQEWAHDTVIEGCLNHTTGNATVRAYKRGSQLELRRKLLLAWSDFVLGRASATVVPFRIA
jgi:integrase